MTTAMDIFFPVFFMIMATAFVIGWLAFTWRDMLPTVAKERLITTVRRVAGRKTPVKSGPPIYTVRLNGELLYASGKTDVEEYCLSGLIHIRGHLLDQCAPGEPLEVVFMRGKETVVVQITRE